MAAEGNSLFVKPSAAAKELAPDLPQRPPYPGAKNYPVADELRGRVISALNTLVSSGSLANESPR